MHMHTMPMHMQTAMPMHTQTAMPMHMQAAVRWVLSLRAWRAAAPIRAPRAQTRAPPPRTTT